MLSKSMFNLGYRLKNMTDVSVSHSQFFYYRSHRPRKSTLADRLLQTTGTVDERQMKEHFSTTWIWNGSAASRLQAARMNYKAKMVSRTF